MYNNSMYGDNQESFPCFSIIYLQSWAKTPQRKYHFTIVCELFTQARDNLFPDSQSQNDNTLLKIWVDVYNYIWYIPQVKHMAIVFLKIYAQQTSHWPTVDVLQALWTSILNKMQILFCIHYLEICHRQMWVLDVGAILGLTESWQTKHDNQVV